MAPSKCRKCTTFFKISLEGICLIFLSFHDSSEFFVPVLGVVRKSLVKGVHVITKVCNFV